MILSRDDIDVSCVRSNDSCDDQESGLSGQEQDQEECGAPDERREVSTFRSRLATVWKFMSDLLPENTNVSRSKQVPRSLLSAPQDEKEQNQWLPLAPMIRHWFDKWITEGKQSSSSQVSTNKEHGNTPRTLGSFPTPYQSRSNHYYQCLSDDFSLKRPTLSSNIEKELKGKKIPDISFGVSMAREIISHLNDGTATATDCSDALSTCLDL